MSGTTTESYSRRRWKPWQTSLRTLILGTTLLGMLAGFFGPSVLRTIREYYSTPSPLPPVPIPLDVRFPEDTSNGYYESAETPLH